MGRLYCVTLIFFLLAAATWSCISAGYELINESESVYLSKEIPQQSLQASTPQVIGNRAIYLLQLASGRKSPDPQGVPDTHPADLMVSLQEKEHYPGLKLLCLNTSCSALSKLSPNCFSAWSKVIFFLGGGNGGSPWTASGTSLVCFIGVQWMVSRPILLHFLELLHHQHSQWLQPPHGCYWTHNTAHSSVRCVKSCKYT